MRRCLRLALISTAAALALALVAPDAGAGPFDKLKKKFEKKDGDKPAAAQDTTSKNAGGSEPGGATQASSGSGSGSAGGAGGSIRSVSTKFDYVPGDSVMFWDDFRQDELGEFPARWRLVDGTFETAEMDSERWVRCTSTNGSIRMKVRPGFPEFWTLEFDFFGGDMQASIALTVTALTAGGEQVWEMRFPYSGSDLDFRCGSIGATTPVPGSVSVRHHVMFMGRGTGLKIYLDQERMVNVPDVTGPGTPSEVNFRLSAPSKPMMTNVRYAEGCRPPKDLLAEGKLVTYGIFFATGSDVVEPESAPVQRAVASYLQANAGVRLRITGYTDNVGSESANLDLSKRRAASVAKVLSTDFDVAADRLESDGKGEGDPVATNATPEGRAMNRRVVFTKIK